MNKYTLEHYKNKISALNSDEQLQRNIYLSQVSRGIIQGPTLDIASISKPWLKYYSEMLIIAPIPEMTAYEYMYTLNNNNHSAVAIVLCNQSVLLYQKPIPSPLLHQFLRLK